MKYILFLVVLLVLIISCVTQHSIIIPDDVSYVSMCEIMKNTKDYYEKNIVLK